jgi:hypothetical protein
MTALKLFEMAIGRRGVRVHNCAGAGGVVFGESDIGLGCGCGAPIAVRRPKHHRGGVKDNDHDEPPDGAQWQRLDEERGEKYCGDSAERETD